MTRFLRNCLSLTGKARNFLSQRSINTTCVLSLQGNDPGCYFVFPELPSDTAESNELLKNVGNAEPIFDGITPVKATSGIGKLAIDFEDGFEKLKEVLNDQRGKVKFENVGVALDSMQFNIMFAYCVTRLLGIVKTSPEMEDACEKNKMTLSRILSEPHMSFELFKAVKSLRQDNSLLNSEEMRLLDKYLLEGKLNGLELSYKENEAYLKIFQDLEKAKNEYNENIFQSTKQFKSHIRDLSVLDECPPEKLNKLLKNPSNPDEGYQVTFGNESYHTFLEYCSDRTQRWNVWAAYSRRAGPRSRKHNNLRNLEKIRKLTQQKAKILGYPTYADLSMTTKMVGSLEQIEKHLSCMVVPFREMAQTDLDKLQQFASSNQFGSDLELWDVAYWRRRHLNENVFVEKDVDNAFPLPHVMQVLRNLCQTLFAIDFVEDKHSSFKTWHEDAKVFKVSNASGDVISKFVFDPYKRDGKLKGAYAEPIRPRCDSAGADIPISACVFSFNPPTDGASVMSFSEVEALFKKFGNMLNQLLTTVPFFGVSGMNNIEWDAAGIAGAFMRKWLDDAQFVQVLSKSSKDGSQLSLEQTETLLKNHNHFLSLDFLLQLYFSKLDISLFSGTDYWEDIMKSLWKEVMPFDLDPNDTHPCCLPLIVSGGYSAAYYSFLWSEVVAADIYQAFDEVKNDREKQSDVGKRFRDTFLSLSGGCHSAELFRRFRGRDPGIEAFLKNQLRWKV